MKKLLVFILFLLLGCVATTPAPNTVDPWRRDVVRWGFIFNETDIRFKTIAYYTDYPDTIVVDQVIEPQNLSEVFLFRTGVLIVEVTCLICGEVSTATLTITSEWIDEDPLMVAAVRITSHTHEGKVENEVEENDGTNNLYPL